MSTTVARCDRPVAGLNMLTVEPHLGLRLGLAGLFIMGTERATMASASLLCMPQDPSPGLK